MDMYPTFNTWTDERIDRLRAEMSAQEDYYKKVKEEQDAWSAMWPNYCKKCGGWGEGHWTENQSPIGSGQNWSMDMADVCECVESGKCPRCGAENAIDEEGQGPCPACNWNNDDGMPAWGD